MNIFLNYITTRYKDIKKKIFRIYIYIYLYLSSFVTFSAASSLAIIYSSFPIRLPWGPPPIRIKSWDVCPFIFTSMIRSLRKSIMTFTTLLLMPRFIILSAIFVGLGRSNFADQHCVFNATAVRKSYFV